jgi:hypothetical protein
LRIVLYITLLVFFVSCSSTKKGDNKQSASVVSPQEHTDINFNTSLAHFVGTIDDIRICGPMKMFIIFSVDTTGIISDPDFKFSNFLVDNCLVDSSYIDDLKKDFLLQMPNWKPKSLSDSITKVRYTIPVRLY